MLVHETMKRLKLRLKVWCQEEGFHFVAMAQLHRKLKQFYKDALHLKVKDLICWESKLLACCDILELPLHT